MSKWIAEFELEDGDTMPEHMDLEYKGAKIDFHCKPLEQEPIDHKAQYENYLKKSEVVISQLRANRDRLLKTLDKIEDEIVDLADSDAYGDYQQGFNFGLMRAAQIIDKYNAETRNKT